MRAISQVRTDEHGHDIVDIATDEDYFRWMHTQKRPIPRPTLRRWPGWNDLLLANSAQ